LAGVTLLCLASCALAQKDPFAPKNMDMDPKLSGSKSTSEPIMSDKHKALGSFFSLQKIQESIRQQQNEPGHAHMFNFFRLAGDFLHLAAFAFLIMRLTVAKSCRGISLKSQELYLAVFLARYVDIFWNFISLYNTVMKLLFIGITCYTVYLMRGPLAKSRTPEANHGYVLIIVPSCAVLALLMNDQTSDTMSSFVVEVLWAFSIYLEAVAIVPQMVLLQRKKIVENLTANYLFTLGGYRVMYLLNYLYRYFTDPVQTTEFLIKVLASIVQGGLYLPFFAIYWKNKSAGGVGAAVVLNQKGIV